MRISTIIRAILDSCTRKDDGIFGDVATEINRDLKQQGKGWIKASDFERMFLEFKESEIYGKMMFYLICKNENEAPDRETIRKMMYVHFFAFRLYLQSIAPKMIDTDIDYCILILSGFKQKDIYKLLTISQSGIRNIKPRLKNKLPSYIFHIIFSE